MASSSQITPFDHKKVENILNYPFKDPSLLIQALTHTSFKGTPSYEKMELIGDHALSMALLNHLTDEYPDLDQGKLTKLLSVKDFCAAIVNEPEEFQSYGGSTNQAPKALADVVEAIAGAIYRDTSRNLDKMWQVVQILLEPLVTPENITDQPVERLYTICDKVKDHIEFQYNKEGTLAAVDFLIHGELVGHGTAPNKKIAKLNAARDALENLKNGKSALLESKPHYSEDEKEAVDKLHKFCERKKLPYPVYKCEKEIGPAGQKKFLYSAQVNFTDDSYLYARGAYKPKTKAAKRSAAFYLLFKVNHHPKHT